MVKMRSRSTEQEIEAFAERAERPAPASRQGKHLPAWKLRNKEPKTGGINFRASQSQLDLIRRAAADQEISQQKILERIVWPALEAAYGAGPEPQPQRKRPLRDDDPVEAD